MATRPAAEATREAAAAAYRDAVLALVGEMGTAGERPVRRVASYDAMATEPPTHLLVTALLDAGVEVLVPLLRSDLDLDWSSAQREVEPGRELRTALADDAEGLGRDAIGSCDLVLVPALAVDRSGTRLGQGGGSYDRALRRRRRAGAMALALVWDGELLQAGRLPRDGHDVPVDAAATPSGGLTRLAGRT